ncbi:MAG: ABC transporter ATP-binding protein [Opitutaceae bacterium]|nr:ABC transporter ATP-binding protein [Opitutaceae bacterium]
MVNEGIPAVDLQDVSLHRRHRTVLEAVSFSLPRGAFLAVVGPNGSGKTSLLHTLNGRLRVEGRLSVLGVDPRKLGWHEAARFRTRVGVMPQTFAAADNAEHGVPLSALEVVELGRTGRAGLGRAFRENDREISAHWLEAVGLARMARRPFFALSGGEQRRVHLARVLAQEPELVLLDEPASQLDFGAQEDLVAMVERVWRQTGATFVMVSHELHHLPPGVTHAGLLVHGRLQDFGAPADILSARRLAAAYGRPILVTVQHGRRVATGGRDA